MTTFLVTNLNDSGAGSLRAAINAANTDPSAGPNIIRFGVSGSINLASGLPSITKAVEIDARTVPSYVAGGPPVVELNFNGHPGLTFSTGSAGSSLLALALGNADGNGVTLNSSNTTLNGNYIGLHANGTAFGNSLDGVYVSSLSSNNQIGINPTGASGVISNVISGNGRDGIALHGSSGNVVVDNRIGTSADGNTAIANGHNGILITEGSNNNTIGGTLFVDSTTGQANDPTGNKGTTTPVFVVPPLGNLVSGNAQNGVLIENGSQNNVLNGNFIGTTANGNATLGNGGDGVHIVNANDNSLIGCQFVNNPFVYYNVVSGNGANGLHVTNSNGVTVQANFFGIGANNATVVANGQNGILIDGSSQNVQVGGVIPLGNVSAGNKANGIYVTDTANGFTTFNTFGGLLAFQGAAPNGNDGILIDSTGGNNLIRTNVFSGNLNNGIEIAGDASGVTVDPNIAGLDTAGTSKTVNTGVGIPSMANGNNGLLITGTAHDNTVGGYISSVIPQNTFSGNTGYGVAITGAAYNNQVFNSGIGTSSTLTAALGNVAGGVLLSSSGNNNLIGGVAVDPAHPRTNFIGGNSGNGITIASGVSGDEIIGNSIGVDRFGLPNLPNSGLPIAINGSYANYILGNTANPVATIIGLPEQAVMLQLEALYVSYFGRAGDPNGINYWMTNAMTQMAHGTLLHQAMINISSAFAVSAEDAKYSSLATQQLNAGNPQQVALATSFIDQVYQNAFSRHADQPGLTYWLAQLFSGKVAFGALAYAIDFAARVSDQVVLNYKLEAGSYFTALTEGSTPSTAAMVGAVQNVTNNTSLLISKASSNSYTGTSENQVDYATAFEGFPVTGVRADYDGKVILTGNQVAGGVTTAALYSGPLQDTSLGQLYAFTPQFAGQTVTGSLFYGPNTSIFTPSIGVGNVIAVGTYLYSQSTVHDHGMIYQGPVKGGGTWTQIDVPSSVVGGAIVLNTVPHSTIGDLVVGDYDLQGVPASGNAFIYNMMTHTWTIFDQPFGGTNQLTTAYGVWQNGIGSPIYTIAGGSNHGTGINQGYAVNFNSISGEFFNLKYYTIDNQPGFFTHFDGITAVPGGFNLAAEGIPHSAVASITVNPDGSFSDAQWTTIDVPGSSATTANSIYQDVGMGIYLLSGVGGVPASYTAVVDQSHVDAAGGLVMPIGALNFNYATTVDASVGSLVVGSQAQGNVLGGSIGNDTFVGTEGVSMSDTIYTGGGADDVLLSLGRTHSTLIELYGGNSIGSLIPVTPGAVQKAIAGSIVSADDVPQLGWWDQATGQLGGPVSNTTTNLGFGSGTSSDLSVVHNFITGAGAGDSIDISLSAFSGLLRSTSPGSPPALGNAVFSNSLSPGGTVTVNNADVLILGSNQSFKDAAAVASALANAGTAINFGVAQTNAVDHYLLAYQDNGGNVRIADLDIHNATPFTNTNQVQTLSVSDMVQLTGVSLAALQPSNVHIVL